MALIFAGSLSLGFQVRQEPSRFDHMVLHDPSLIVGVKTLPIASLDADHPKRLEWKSFLSSHGKNWKIYIDGRSAAPLLVEGQGIPWTPGEGNNLTAPANVTMEYLEKSLRRFISENTSLLQAIDGELILNEEASAKLTPEVWQITFNRTISGVPVRGDRYIFTISHGNLVSFGANRWSKITSSPIPALDGDAAFQSLADYMQLTDAEQIEFLSNGDLFFLPLGTPGTETVPYEGEVGRGYDSALVWTFTLRVAGEAGTWVGMVDAHTGDIHALYDENKYAQVKGGVYPESSDQICPSGCEQPNFPMAFADIDLGGTPITANSMGLFECDPAGTTATTTLNGPYVRVNDNCGPISESVTCDEDLDLGVSGGADCAVPPGSGGGNTHASRSSFYHLNRAKEHAMAWLPSNTWLTNKLTDNVNISSTCNAYWNGSVNFYKSGGGCNNTGEIAGVVLHEWGHGFDQNDGGGYDNPSEAYADISEFMYDHTSCIGRGFWQTQQCSGYGNPCIDCTGIRDQDWDKREDHTPSTAAGFIGNNCGGGGGPCGKETHCEGYLGGETIWDLAARDFPAMGLDDATAWQLMDKIWFKSRAGSGSNAYNCSPPDSDGCGANTWFTKFRNIDDDDGNLNNGTPHAAAIFAAFDRHNIACGDAGDASNQNNSSCPTIGDTTLSGAAGSNSASLSWTAVPDAAYYNVLRNDLGCDHSFTLAATVDDPSTSYTDDGLANDFPEYYRVQAVGSNFACDGPVSNCVEVTPQPFAGSIKFNRSSYNCSDTITINVRDANVGSSTTEATIWSGTETTPETVTLTETEPGSSKFVGTIDTTPDSPSSDGLLSLVDSDIITAQYIDEDDGEGGHGLVRQTTSGSDCIGPIISNVASSNVTDVKATISWITDEASDSVLTWGGNKPPSNETSTSDMVTSHSITLTGLQECTVYYYQVSSSDSSHNTAVDDNLGIYYHFETLGDFGYGLQSCHEGRITVFGNIYSCSDTITFEVVDIDLNLDPNVIDTGTVQVTSTTEADPEFVAVTETGPFTSKFTGSVQTTQGTPTPDGLLQSSDKDTVTVTYVDADDGTGATAIVFGTKILDCADPGIHDLRVSNITDQRFTVSFDTDDPGDTKVEWGSTPSLGEQVVKPGLRTSHEMILNQFNDCDLFYIRVSSTDEYGNTAVADLNGDPHLIHTWEIPGLYHQETFEGDTSGWTLEGEWQIGTPQGLGGTSGYPDPYGAYNNTMAIGNDLTGLGIRPGEYENMITEEATSPSVSASSWTNTKLILYRQLNVMQDDTATLSVVRGGQEDEIYNSGTQAITQNGYSMWTYDVSGLVDGKNSVELKFHISSDHEIAPAQFDDGYGSGWNVDDIIFKDGTLPDYSSCGGCSTEPSFRGAVSAIDNDSCGADGVTVSWEPAVSWGTGDNGTYSLYRDSVPDFAPTASNRIALGLTNLSYNDLSAPTDQTLYYLVRAENDEICSTGPNNGGVTDDNTVYVTVGETTSWAVPDEVTTLRVEMVNRAHVKLSWEAPVGATLYRIYRSDAPNGVFTLLGETENMSFEDLNEGSTPDTYYYRVRGVNPCGHEGP
jgi:fibronectin type 3 domain-containing protein